MRRKAFRFLLNTLAFWGLLNITMVVYRLVFPEEYEKLRVSLGLPAEETASQKPKGRRK